MLASGGAAVLLLAISALSPAASSGVRSLDGEWRYHAGALERAPAALPADWPSMTVPSNWYAEGLDVSGVVWFAKEVDFMAAGRFVAEFDAVDYDAAVFWDGEPVGSHRGYFAPFTVNLPPVLGPGSHVLSVRVDSPLETSAAWSLHKTLIKGVLSHHDTRPGGAWSPRGQNANTGGIWGTSRKICFPLHIEFADSSAYRSADAFGFARFSEILERARAFYAKSGLRFEYVFR